MTELDPAAVLAALTGDPSLRVFVRGGVLAAMPARLERRRRLLDVVAQAFVPGVRYQERVVDQFLRSIHHDQAALRRYLVDEDFLSRAGGEYWRIGGTVLPV